MQTLLGIAELFQVPVAANHYSFSQRSLDTFNTWHKVEASSLLQDVEVGNFCYFMSKAQLSSLSEWVTSCTAFHAVRRNEHLKEFRRVLPALLCKVVMITAIGTVHVTPLAHQQKMWLL